MAAVVWLDEAFDQLDLIVAYIAQFDPDAAERIGGRLIALGESLADFPNRGRPASDGTREMVIVRPYILRYEVIADTVTIIGIRHSAQRSPD